MKFRAFGLAGTLVLLCLLTGCANLHYAPPRAASPAPAAEDPEPEVELAPLGPPSAVVPVAPAAQGIGAFELRIRLGTGVSNAVLVLPAGAVLEGPAPRQLAAGSYTLRLDRATPAVRRYHLFVKTFVPDQWGEIPAYVEQWRQRGREPQVVAMGRSFSAADGRTFDNRVQYVSLLRFPTRAAAEAGKARLESEGQWSWIEEELVRPGSGDLVLADSSGRIAATVPTPAVLRPNGPATLNATVQGQYSGALEFEVGPDGRLTLYERLPLEEYLKGVLPAEMPALWPAPALQAQALAARSEVLANLGVKHKLEGFDYCAAEHCRAYRGFGGRHPNADAAVEATVDRVLTDGHRVIPTVFSACCGGWTENNDNVWSSPPMAALRGVGDYPRGANPAPGGLSAANVAAWLRQSAPAFCSGDASNYRWTRRYDAAELSSIVGRSYDVGSIRDIRLGERGVSGRLKSVEIVGSKRTVTVTKEFPIRQAFGGLPSALFILEVERGPGGPRAFVFRGGGRGHGVGLCQQGARGMATRGMSYGDILAHYFTGAQVVRLNR